MTNKIYLHETKFTRASHENLAKIKVQGDRWCKKHCADLHKSKMIYGSEDDCVIFYFRSDSDLTAFRIGFDVYDL